MPTIRIEIKGCGGPPAGSLAIVTATDISEKQNLRFAFKQVSDLDFRPRAMAGVGKVRRSRGTVSAQLKRNVLAVFTVFAID